MEAHAVSDKAPISEVATAPVPLMVFVRVPVTVSTTAFTISPVPLMALTICSFTDSTMLFCAMAHLLYWVLELIVVSLTRIDITHRKYLRQCSWRGCTLYLR